MTRGAFLYEGKAKKLYETDEPGLVIVEFKDDATAGNGQKRGTIRDKGRINAAITAHVYSHLEQCGVKTHLRRQIAPNVLLVRRLQMLPLEVVVRNLVAGSLQRRLGLAEGSTLEPPVLELYYKNDALGDPMLNRAHVRAMGLASEEQLDLVEERALQINALLQPFMQERGLLIADFKLEFGWLDDELVLGDEITPDTCRLWDATTRKKLDKDRFRQDLGGVDEAYAEVLQRVVG